MQTETNIMDYEIVKAEKETKSEKFEQKEGEIRLFGMRSVITDPIPACEKIDKLFGSGGEVIIHYMWFEQGYSLFDRMLRLHPNKLKEELLRELINIQPQTGWGIANITIRQADPPTVEIVVKNPPVKTLKGSQKHLIGSFWAGVFTRYFDRQLICKNFVYNVEKDEFSCTITI